MPRRTRLVAGGAALVAFALAASLVWWFVFRDTSPPSVLSAEQEAVRDEAVAEADEPTDEPTDEPAEPTTEQAEPATEEPATEPPAEPPAEESAGGGVDGTWSVDTAIGSFDDFSSSFVGFRIDEELATIGAKTAVGRTPGVEGTLEIEGTTVTAVDMVADMTGLTTDDSRRDRALRQQAIETSVHPTATFTLIEPIALGEVPVEGEPVQVEAVGELTIHGVTNPVTIPLQAELVNDVIVVAGELGPFPLELYDIDRPSAAAVLSVEDEAIMELQLFFTR